MTRLPETEVPQAPQPSTDALCRDLIDALHAASQPLTILRASLGRPEVTRQPVAELRKLLRRSAKEVERLCVLFDFLQQLVAAESIKAELEMVDLPRLLNHTVEGVDLLFANAGVTLTCQPVEEAPPYVFVDSSRLESALSGILLVVLGQSGRGDEVVVKTSPRGACVEINVESALGAPANMVAETRLRLALAAANLRSLNANMASTLKPFIVTISLPTAETPVLV